MSPVRHCGAPGPVHEPFCLQLPPVPATATPRPVVTDMVVTVTVVTDTVVMDTVVTVTVMAGTVDDGHGG